MSFMFTVTKDKWEGLDTDKPTRHITAIGKIFEVSAVTWPAYEQTTFEARSKAEALESAEDTLESARANVRKEAAAAEAEKRKADRESRVVELEAKLRSIKEG